MELAPGQAEREWSAGRFRPVYYLAGEDPAPKRKFLERLKALLKPDPFNLNEYPGDPNPAIEDIVSASLTPPLGGARRLVAVRGALRAEARRALAEYLSAPLETTVLLLVSEERKPDVRDALTAACAALGGLVLFKPLSEGEAATRLAEEALRRGVRLEAGAAQLIVSEAGTGWGVLSGELEKLALYAKGKGSVGAREALACLGYRRSANPFDLPRMIQRRDGAAALGLARRLLSEGEEPLKLLYQIAGTIQKQLKAKRMRAAGAGEPEIFRELRLQSYYDREFMRWAAGVSEARLREELAACVRAEARLKSESWLDAGAEVEGLIAGIARRR